MRFQGKLFFTMDIRTLLFAVLLNISRTRSSDEAGLIRWAKNFVAVVVVVVVVVVVACEHKSGLCL